MERPKTPLLDWLLMAIVFAVFMALVWLPVFAQDWSKANPEIRDWFEGLKNSEGLRCCDTSDGHVIDSSQYELRSNGYYVYIPEMEKWYHIPESRILNEPNKIGKAVVWYKIFDGLDGKTKFLSIYCLMPANFF